MGKPFQVNSFVEILLTEKGAGRANSDGLQVRVKIYTFGLEAERTNRNPEMKQTPLQDQVRQFRLYRFTAVDEVFPQDCAELPVDLLTEEGLIHRSASEIDYLLDHHISTTATNESHTHPTRALMPSKQVMQLLNNV